jgi:hypothetical protein
VLHLQALARERAGVTTEAGAYLGQAAAVCLEREGHRSGVTIHLEGEFPAERAVQWLRLPEAAGRSWADSEEATECGASGVAILLVEAFTGLEVIERSRKGTRCDYWLGDPEDAALLFQRKARLEVSGIGRGDASVVAGRVRQKVAQISGGDSRLPAVVVVVEFGRPTSVIARP